MNKLDSQDVLVTLCQHKTEQLSTTAADDTVYVQQCMKQNHEKDIIWSKLWISLRDLIRFMSAQILKSESNIEYCWAQETACWSYKENWGAEEMNNKDKIIWGWWESIFMDEQHVNEEEEQETHEQEHWVIHDQEKHQGAKLWARLILRNVNTLSISCINASMMQSIHITLSHINVCWTWNQIWSREHSKEEND